ncbi:hypothetical protein PGT21_012585 [Puccinia graminis f. sp. tritici]|uniref:Uncharacterized protein n=1 Tax=Puccinia graminis f. sp. tritici TaxID=56615 RepID=A0A5B0PRK2_PUCGR|nr:hypothetical protein PGT21_012585 [Puccinia graminis f. sp. tritici]
MHHLAPSLERGGSCGLKYMPVQPITSLCFRLSATATFLVLNATSPLLLRILFA